MWISYVIPLLMCSKSMFLAFKYTYTLSFVPYRDCFMTYLYTLYEAWSGVNWADLMTAQGAFGTDFYDRSTRTIVGTMLWTEYK